jgi:hypothetical protein
VEGDNLAHGVSAMTTALAVTDEVPLLIRAVGDLAAAAEVSLEEVAAITQCTALGELAASCPLFIFCSLFCLEVIKGEFMCVDAGNR